MAAILEYKCPCCGGVIEFDSTSQQMKCPYCDTIFDAETLKNYDDVLSQAQEDDMTWETAAGSEWQEGETDGMSVYQCESCGGEIIAAATTGATRCPYCDNPVIMSSRFAGDLRPDYVIPFRLDKKAAKEAMRKHLQGKRLLPKVFKEENHLDEIKGVYVPFWLFDADVEADVRYKATKLRVWSDNTYDYTETKHYLVHRAGNIGFERVPVDGSTQMPDDLMESIEPFDFADAVDFQTAYLSGYLADRYDVSSEESVNRANQRIKTSAQEAFAATVDGYATVTPESTSVRLSQGKAQYALYPVWLLNTSWNGEKYIFAMNGQTGKFVGNLPLDKKAYWKWFGAITSICTAVMFAAMFVLWLI